MRSHPHPPSPRRGGYGLVEMAVTGVLLAAMVLLVARVTASVATQRQVTTRREVAARVAAGLVEEARALPWDRLTTDGVRPLASARLAEVSTLAASRASIRVTVEPAPGVGGSEVRRLVVTVAWPDPTRGGGAPVRLVAWAFKPGSAGGEARP